MADKRIEDFPTLSEAKDDDLILISSKENSYNMKVSTLMAAARKAAVAAAGGLQDQITEADERLALLERMALHNEFSAPIAVDDSGAVLVDDLGFAIVADWKYKEV